MGIYGAEQTDFFLLPQQDASAEMAVLVGLV